MQPSVKLLLRDCATGRGVFADQFIPAGTHIIEFTGPFLRQDQTTAETYALQIAPDLYIGPSGGLDDFINHSCRPNCGMKIEGSRANLYAIADIRSGEQIAFDYSTVMAEEGWEMSCQCGQKECRGVIRTGRFLPPTLRETYRRLGVLADYV